MVQEERKKRGRERERVESARLGWETEAGEPSHGGHASPNRETRHADLGEKKKSGYLGLAGGLCQWAGKAEFNYGAIRLYDDTKPVGEGKVLWWANQSLLLYGQFVIATKLRP